MADKPYSKHKNWWFRKQRWAMENAKWPRSATEVARLNPEPFMKKTKAAVKKMSQALLPMIDSILRDPMVDALTLMQNSMLHGGPLTLSPYRLTANRKKSKRERKRRMNADIVWLADKIQSINYQEPKIDELAIWENFSAHLKQLSITPKIRIERGIKHVRPHNHYSVTRWDNTMNFLKDVSESMGKNSKKERFTMRTKNRAEENIISFLAQMGPVERATPFVTDAFSPGVAPNFAMGSRFFPAEKQFKDMQPIVRQLLAMASYDDVCTNMDGFFPSWRLLIEAYAAGLWKARVTEKEAILIVRPCVDSIQEAIPSELVGGAQPEGAIERAVGIPRRTRPDRLHNDKGPTFYWDNEAYYFIKGVNVSEKVVLAPETLTPVEIEDEVNQEVRRTMMERYGVEKYFKQSGAKKIHKDETGILYRKEIRNGRGGGEDLCFVRVKNSTPEPDGSIKEYWLRVPPEMETAREAVAWTFGQEADAYKPLSET